MDSQTPPSSSTGRSGRQRLVAILVADLAGQEPLFEALRLAGMPE